MGGLIRFGMCLVATAVCAAAASGEELDRPETAANRARPELDPLGARLGAFVLQASVAGGYEYNDNIFATRTGEENDNILTLGPLLEIGSDWGRHRLAAGAEIDAGRYLDNDSEDYDDWRIYAEGRLDLASGRVTGSASHADEHEARTSPDDFENGARPAQPTEFTVDAYSLVWLYAPGRLSVTPAVSYELRQFDDNVDTLGNPISNADRDRSELRASVRPAYALAEGYDVFVEAATSIVDYDQSVDNDGFERSSDGYEVLVGSTLNPAGKTFGEAYVGYRSWSYDDPRFEDIDGLAFGLDLQWNVTGLTTLGLLGESTIASTTIENAAGIQRTALGFTADHELLRSLVLSLAVEWANEDFEGIDREDELVTAGFGAKYMLSRRFYAYFGIDHQERDESGTDSVEQEYDLNIVYLRLQGNL